jgi:hypothetical protein
LAAVITLGASVYQRFTGPSYPKQITAAFQPGETYRFSLPRSQGGIKDARVELTVADTNVSAVLWYKRYPTNEKWEMSYMIRNNNKLLAFLPNQPPAGKLEYYITLLKNEQKIVIPENESVIIRFRGDVPAPVILPHIILMFAAMLLSNLAALLALLRDHKFRLYTYITTALLLVGGMIMGPVVQKFAFGEFWTGFPKGLDLTDNKTLVAFIFWIIALVVNLKKERRWATIMAALVMLLIFSIPHSTMGSELDYESGQVKTGMVFQIRYCFAVFGG